MVSVDGALGYEATYYLKHISEHICMKCGKSYGEVMGCLPTSLSFAIIRAPDLCLRGRWRSALDMADGIGLCKCFFFGIIDCILILIIYSLFINII